MTSRISKLVLAAALAGAAPSLAAAHDHDRDCDHDRDDRPVVVTAPVYAPPPAWAPPPETYPAPPAYRDGWRGDRWGDRDGAWHGDRWGDRDGTWRDGGWRVRALAAVRADLAALDARRAEFHERNAWRPGMTRRFDRWYFARRAELERRELELERVAWR